MLTETDCVCPECGLYTYKDTKSVPAEYEEWQCRCQFLSIKELEEVIEWHRILAW